MSRGFGKVQLAIIAELYMREGGDVVEAHYRQQIKLAPGVYDIRPIAKKLNDDGCGFSSLRKQASFSRALAKLIESGTVQAHTSLVPLADYWPDTEWSDRVLKLADGLYFNPPSGPKWRHRFVSLK